MKQKKNHNTEMENDKIRETVDWLKRMNGQMKEMLQKYNTRKISEVGESCRNPGHNPPSHMVLSNGIYEHICPGCGNRQMFTVNNPTL